MIQRTFLRFFLVKVAVVLFDDPFFEATCIYIQYRTVAEYLTWTYTYIAVRQIPTFNPFWLQNTNMYIAAAYLKLPMHISRYCLWDPCMELKISQPFVLLRKSQMATHHPLLKTLPIECCMFYFPGKIWPSQLCLHLQIKVQRGFIVNNRLFMEKKKNWVEVTTMYTWSSGGHQQVSCTQKLIVCTQTISETVITLR